MTTFATTETGFRVERGSSESGPFGLVGTVLANVVMFSDHDTVAPDTQYCYRVLAFNDSGNSASSNFSSVTTPSLVIPPVAPGNLVATAQAVDRIDLSWQDN